MAKAHGELERLKDHREVEDAIDGVMFKVRGLMLDCRLQTPGSTPSRAQAAAATCRVERFAEFDRLSKLTVRAASGA